MTDEASQNFTYGYDIANKLTSKTMPNGVSSTFDYDGMSRLTRLRNQSGATLTDNQFSYNPANQISQIAELTQIKNFTYDNIDRLTVGRCILLLFLLALFLFLYLEDPY